MSTPVARGQVSFSQLRDGTDGNGVEYVYLRTNSSTPPSIANNNDYTEVVSGETVTRHYTDDDFCPMSSTGERCSDSPTGVDNTHQYEWVATREMTDVNDSGEREWKPYELTTMTLWSKYGARGTDGDGVEYVFARTQDETAPSIIDNDSYTEGGVTYSVTDDDFRPNSSVGRCTDDPSGTNPTWKYEWVMMRSKGAPDATGVRQWNPYALGPMALWSKYASDGEMASALVLEPSIVTLVYSTEVDEWFADKYSKVSLRYADAEYLPLNIKIYNEQSNLICEAEVVSDADEGGALAEDSLRINIIYEDETVDAILEPEIITYVTKWGHDQYHRPIKIRVQVEPFVALRLKTFNSGGYDDFYYNIEATYQRTINPGTWEQEVITITGSGRLTFAIDSVDTDIQDLNDRIDDIEGGSASRIEVTGTGCALTDVSKSGSVVTFTKGNPAFSDITNTPVTLSGYGITDAMRVIVLEDNGTTTAGTWLAKSNPANLITSYGDGLVVLYKITKAGAATTTLNINGLGAKTVYRNGSNKMTTQYAVGSYVLLYYASGLNSGSFVSFADYDANSYAYVRHYATTGDVEYPLLSRYNTTSGSAYYTEYTRYAAGVTLNPANKSITASKFIVSDGTSSGFLKGDGSVDTTAYATSASLSGYYTRSETDSAISSAIRALPNPMLFRGTLGTGGSITSLPTASSSNEGWTYKVITAGTYAGQAAKIGDMFISNGTAWMYVPSGDEPSGTVTSVGLTVPTGLSVSGSPITTSGTLKVAFSSGYSIPTTAKQTAWDAKYDKPSTGIPKTDLVSAVQTSLGKADTAYQKPTDGIGTADLDSDVNAKLELASTALQSHQTIYSLTIKNSESTTQLTYTPNSGAGSLTLTKAMVGLGNVENTKLSTWTGTNKITTVGTITTGTWNGTAIANAYLANSSITIGSKTISLGGTATLSNIGIPTWAQASSLAFASLPPMYIAKNAVQPSSAVQNLTGLGSLLPDMNGNYDLGRGYVSESVPALYWSHLYVDEAVVEYIKGKNTDYITLETDIIPSGNKSLGWDAAPFHHVGTKSIGYNDYGDNIWKIDDSGNATFSGTLTVTGASTFNDSITIDGDIVPLADDNYDLGSVSGGNVKAWSNVFTHNIYVDTIQGGTEIQQVDIACDLVPAADSQAGLGLVNSPFYNLYVDNTHTGALYATDNIYLLNAQNASAAAGGAQKKIWFDGSTHSANSPYLEVVNIGTTQSPVWAIHTNVGFYSDSFITAGGIGTSGGSGGGGLIETLHRYADLGGSFSDSANDTFNAYTINKINTDLAARITALEGGSATNVSTTGSGNVITAVTKSGNTLTFTKGITALTSHQSLDGYVNEIATGTGNYITGVSKSGKKLTFTYGTLPTTIALSNVTGADDLKAIEALTGTSGLLKKTAANKWTLDTTSYATAASLGNYLPLSGGQMTGPLTWKNSTALPEASSASFFLTIDSFANGGTTKWVSLSNVKTSLGLGDYLKIADAADTYVKLNPGASEQTIRSSIGSFVKGVVNLWRSSGDHYTFLGFSNGTTETYLGGIGFKSQSDHNLYRKYGGNYYKIYDENNLTLTKSLVTDALGGTPSAMWYAYNGTEGYWKIHIKSKNSWMISFNINLYSLYHSSIIRVGGYNYASTKKWYEPRAVMVASTSTNSIDVAFGKDGDNDLWVVVPVSSYNGISITDVVYGNNGNGRSYDADAFEITKVTEIPETVVSTVTVYRPLSLHGGTITGNLSVNGAITASIGNDATSTANGINFVYPGVSGTSAHIGVLQSGYFGIYANNDILFRPDGATTDVAGNGSLRLTNAGATLYQSLTAEKFIKSGGTSSQFLKADGSVDSNTYLTTSSAASTYVTALGVDGEDLTWTKNDTVNHITVPFAESVRDMKVEEMDEQVFTSRQTADGSLTWNPSSALARRIKGNTIVWNQLVVNDHYLITPTATLDYVGTIASLGRTVNITKGHVYYMSGIVNRTIHDNNGVNIRFNSTNPPVLVCPNEVANGRISTIATATTSFSSQYLYYNNYAYARGLEAGDSIEVSDLFLTDLTLMFGAGNEPTTVEEFEAMFPLSYYAHDAGTLLSNAATGIETVGRNLWDEEFSYAKGYYDNVDGKLAWKTYSSNLPGCVNLIPVLPNTTYFFQTDGFPGIGAGTRGYANVRFADADLNFISSNSSALRMTFTTPANARWMSFNLGTGYGSVYNHDICISLSDPDRNGTYEPYWKRSLPLKLNTLKGKLNGTGESVVVFPDGLRSAGTVYDEIVGNKAIKRIGDAADLSSLTWSLGDYANHVFNCNLTGATDVSDIITTRYTSTTISAYAAMPDKSYCVISGILRIKDSGYSNANAFAASLADAILLFLLKTPEEYILDEAIPTMMRVDRLGTESVYPANGEVPYTAPMRMDIQYGTRTGDIAGSIAEVRDSYLPLSGGALTGELSLTGSSKKLWFGDTYYIELVNIGTIANPQYALHTNAPLYSDGFITAGGVNANA